MDVDATPDIKKPAFTPIELRILACVMEKHLATPNNYPLTINALTSACNQKTSREPVMNVREGEVGHTVNLLVERGLLKLDFGDRASKVSHKMRGEFGLDAKKQAVLTVLMLRAPQTLNDIRARTARMSEFESNAEIQTILEGFCHRTTPLAACLPAGAGRREARYACVMAGEPEWGSEPYAGDAPSTVATTRQLKLDELEHRVAVLEDKLKRLEVLLD